MKKYYMILLLFFQLSALDINANEKNLYELNNQIFNDLNLIKLKNNNSFGNPLIIVNPFQISPLTAYIIFNNEIISDINVKINKKDICHFDYNIKGSSNIYMVPIIGLKEGKNDIILKFKKNNLQKSFVITTDKINIANNIKIKINNSNNCLNEMILLSPTYPNQPGVSLFAFNKSGDIVWFLSDKNIGASSSLFIDDEGKLLINSEKNNKRPYYYSSYYKIDLMGRIFEEIKNNGYGHHEIIQLPNKNYLALVDKYIQNTIEDRVVEFDNEGNIIKEWDLKKILKLKTIIAPNMYKYYALDNDHKLAQKDWIHLNSLAFNKNLDGNIIVSSRALNAIINIGYQDKKIKWIITDPHQKWITPNIKKYLLKTKKPKNYNPYSYGQHSIFITKEKSLLVFDNGLFSDLYNRKIYDKSLSYNLKNNRSRVLEYFIDYTNKMFDVKVIHQKNYYYYSAFLGSVSKNNNKIIINYGGILKESNMPSDNIRKILFGELINSSGFSSIFEINDKKEVFNADIKGNKITTTYRTKLLNVSELLNYNKK